MALGQQLHEARLARKETASQVAAATRMKVQIIEALETEDFSKIPAPIYGRGFIKLYAEHVGLDAQPMIQEYMTEFHSRPAPSLDAVTQNIVKAAPEPEEEPAKEKKAKPETQEKKARQDGPDLFAHAGVEAEKPPVSDEEDQSMPGLFDRQREPDPVGERGPLPAPPPSETRETDREDASRPPEKDTRPERLVDGPLDQMAKETRAAPLINLAPLKNALEKAGTTVLDRLEAIGAAGAKKLRQGREALQETRFDPSEFTYSKSPAKFISLMVGITILLIFVISGLSRCFGTCETEPAPTAGAESPKLHIAADPPAPYFD